MEQTRADLKIKFDNGKRPSGPDFADLLDSFVNPKDDNFRKDGSGNFVVTLGNAPDVPAPAAGTLRFTAGKVQFSTGAAWQDVGAGSGGGFQSVGGSANIAYSNGNVGIGTAAAQPTAKLEVALAIGEQAKIGNVSVGNSAAPLNGFIQMSHVNRANATDFALRQGPNGNVNVNAPANQKLILSKGGNQSRLSVIENGSVIVGGETDISGTGAALQVNGDLFINANAIKPGGGPWQAPSDARLKKDIRPFTDGLAKVLQINPVNFRYNGLAQTPDNSEQVGILGQEMASILPYTVSTARAQLKPEETPTDILIFDPNALVYVLINAVKELAGKVQSLEQQLAGQ
ncbi:tail fiber domain-containing protein [Spirosoma taeanense]|uniref:Tail fiber domain-containing protein n=1 Tax=Spirosoma taeanense TaxID=2735870 RepID=A0A6M5Y5M4_9BACT|nr:tail fiber domain-containing protein [Spirosoma taeanense]QJW89139.1 tail fiber domain-containing protein [Spirosoma taeanense]